MSTLSLELIVWHHKRRTRRQPYSAAAYLLDPSKPEHHQVIEAGSCTDAGTEGEAARDALRDLHERCERLGGASELRLVGEHDAESEVRTSTLVRVLADPVGAISERRFV